MKDLYFKLRGVNEIKDEKVCPRKNCGGKMKLQYTMEPVKTVFNPYGSKPREFYRCKKCGYTKDN